jgi:threonine/homoserine/homoserine lactone efflux protein
MPDLSTLGLFALACLALTATPGPDMLLIASRSASQGRAAGFASLAGIQVGTYCHALAAAFGLSQLFLAVPLAYDIVRCAGAAYLLYLPGKHFFWQTERYQLRTRGFLDTRSARCFARGY